MVQCPPTGGCTVERSKKKTEKPSLAAQCRILTESAVLWALLAAGAQLFFPEEQSLSLIHI